MPGDAGAKQPGLKRVLGLWALVIYGIILIQPTAPMAPYGVVCETARGHVVTTILIAMVAMLFTAVSYGRMANAYPSAGSAYTYVGQELHAAWGYLTGWAMIFDYVMNPILSVIFCSKATMSLAEATSFIPRLPFPAWALFFAVLFTLLNLRGIESSSRTNALLAAGLGAVVALFLVAAVRSVWNSPGLAAGRFLHPFYDPRTFSWATVSTGTSMAMLTYIGFDGISTLSEEAHNPRRNILLATVLTCLITGILASAEVYCAQLVRPSYVFADKDTAIFEIAREAGGPVLFFTVNVALLVAQIGSGMGAQLGGGRLLYAMGRDQAIPRRFFGALDPRTRIPRNNILLLGGLALIGALLIDFDLSIELLNFGALIGFMGVNIAAFVRYYVRSDKKTALNLALPLLGFLFCLYVWWSLKPTAKVVGLAWLAVGLLFGAWKTRGFRRKIEFIVPREDETTTSLRAQD
jgi:amino acid transporter